MPPKKNTAAIKAKAATKKEKTAKEKPVAEENAVEEVPAKKKRTAATKEKAPTNKGKTLKEKQIAEENPAEEVPTKTKRTAASKAKASTKKEKTPKEDPVAEENIAEEAPPKKKRAAASKSNLKGKQGKKDNKEEDEADEAGDVKKAPVKTLKRKAAKAEDTESEPAEEKKSKATTSAGPKNATVTDWKLVDFTCASKTPTGKPPNFHIISWNVDGMRAWLKKGGLGILEHDQPDILCLQETKCSKEKIPDEMNEVDGYEAFWCSSDKEGYAGVGVLTKIKPLSVIYGIDSEEHDNEGRSIALEFEKFYLVNVYVPNAGRKLVTLPKRLDWNEAFKAFIKKLDDDKPVIVCGDMNVAHKEIDLANPKTNTKNAGFTVEEREGMTDFLEDGYVDTFRDLYPEKEKAYTFWTYMSNARTKNVGWRLDYFVVSERFKENVCDNVILQNVLGSDHCPIVLHVNI